MQRILLGLLLISGTIGAVAVGSTSAFFSDTETSRNNRFTAGAIDLKIDHTRQTYNGNECEVECTKVGEDLSFEAKFEVPEITTPQQWNVFDSPVTGWTVEWRSDVPATFGSQNRPAVAKLEIHENVLGAAHQGDQYAELDSDWGGPTHSGTGEPASVSIYRTIPTVAGTKYRVSFAFAARPNTGAADNRLEVKWGGIVAHDTGPVADPNAGIEWQIINLDVLATTTSTQLRFTDLGTANSMGTFLDSVYVFALQCDTSNLVGGQCKLWDEKDLGEGDIFWNFNDVKPGDSGTNVISLHVYDNDAFACMLTKDVTDNENGVIEPETVAGDNLLDGIPNGELSDFIKLFIWGDDGDGIYEPGSSEGSLYQGGFTDVEMSRLSLEATTTAYVGVAWCFGEQTVDGGTGAISCDGSNQTYNIAQTDIMMADLEFYAVQQRNNGDFQCSDVPQGGEGGEGGEPYSQAGYYSQGEYYTQGEYYAQASYTPTALFTDNFGTGNTDATFDENTGGETMWTEGGAGADKRNAAGGGDESISDGDGGRKAAMIGPNGYICKSVNATGYNSLSLAYSWRGDSNAEAGDNGLVQYATGGTCASPTGLTTVATHPLTTTTWQSTSAGFGAVDNSNFLLFFRVDSNAADEDFRIDAVTLSGNAI